MTDLRAGSGDIPNTVYTAMLGATTWTKVANAAGLVQAFLRAVSYDASGHPKALWAVLPPNNQNGPSQLIAYPL